MILLQNELASVRQGRYQSPTFDLPSDTLSIHVVLARPLTSIERATIKLISPERGSLVVGGMTGGVRPGATDYSLQVNLTCWLGDEGREYIKTTTKDASGYYNDVPLDTICRSSSTGVYLLIESDTISEVLVVLLETTAGEQPTVRTKNSVAFDAATSATESSGDGVLSLTHTCSGSDRALFASCGAAPVGGGTSSTMTFSGAGMTEQWDHDVTSANNFPHAGYTLLNPSASASQTLTSTLDNNETNKHSLGCVSLTGVGSVGNVQSSVSTTSPISNTVTGAGADDMVVDSVYGQLGGAPSVGANQTERVTQANGSDFLHQSTQDGADGGVMSWSQGSVDYWGHGAVNFVATTGITVSLPVVSLAATMQDLTVVTSGQQVALPALSMALTMQSIPVVRTISLETITMNVTFGGSLSIIQTLPVVSMALQMQNFASGVVAADLPTISMALQMQALAAIVNQFAAVPVVSMSLTMQQLTPTGGGGGPSGGGAMDLTDETTLTDLVL